LGKKRKARSFRTPSRRFRVWNKKMDADTYSAILPKVKPLASEDVRMYQVVHEDLIKIVKDVLSRNGSEYARLHGYLSFAEKIWYAIQHYSSKALQLEADAYFLLWVYRGYYDEVLREIAKKLGVEISTWDTIMSRLGVTVAVDVEELAEAVADKLELKKIAEGEADTVSGTEVVIYEYSDTEPFKIGAHLDLSNMTDTDEIEIRVYIKISSDAPYKLFDKATYTGVQSAPIVYILPHVAHYGYRIVVYQISGDSFKIPYEIFKGKTM